MNARMLLAVVFTIALFGGAAPGGALAEPIPEFRGVWVTRFEWTRADGDRDALQQRIRSIMDTVARANFNAVVFQVRGQADVLYPSPFEPWSRLIGGRDPGFDPLVFAIQEAHARGLEFHAYINAFPCWDKQDPPVDPNHMFNKHPDWLCRDARGNLLREEYQYFSPGNPEVQAYVRAVIMDVVQRYDVDGIHLDRIRYPSPQTSHDPVSEARFKGLGNPGSLSWADWQRAQITGFCNDLYGQIVAVKPRVKLTSSVWGIYDKTRIPGYSSFSSGFHDYYQDSHAWIRLGVMDALVPMIYWDIGGKKPDYDELYKDFLSDANGRPIYGGMQTKYDDRNEPIREIEYTRSVGGAGTVAFSFSGIDNANAWSYYQKAYAEKAPVPGMAWKSDPDTGSILGVIRTPAGVPVPDAWVRLNDLPSVWLSSGDGLFSILHLQPGFDYTVTIDYPGAQRAVLTGMKVVSATVTRLQVVLQPDVSVAQRPASPGPAADAAAVSAVPPLPEAAVTTSAAPAQGANGVSAQGSVVEQVRTGPVSEGFVPAATPVAQPATLTAASPAPAAPGPGQPGQ